MTVFFFSYNNIQDYKDDARDKSKTKHNPISQKKISLFWAKIISFSSLAISLLLFYLLGLNTFLIGLVIGSICFLYSWKRVRLKSKPVVDLVSHGMFHALIFFNTTLITNNTPNITSVLIIAVLFFFLSALVDFESEIRDSQVDKKAKIGNTVSKLKFQRKTGRIFGYFSAVPVILIGIYTLFNVNLLTQVIMTLIFTGAAYHYIFIWRRKCKFINYYPYAQKLLVVFSLVIYSS